VTRFEPGDRVFGHLPIRETHTVVETKVEHVPEGMTPEQLVYWDPAEFALGAVRDANVRLGDVVALFGLGAIGFMTLQMAKMSGARTIFAVDPLPKRRAIAERLGADYVLDPTAVDVSRSIRDANGGQGADLSIEASGAYPALHEAIRCVAIGGLVVPLAFYIGEATGLRLGEEAHMNRVTLRFSRSITEPNRDHPMWDSQRIKQVAFDLLKEGRLSVDGLIDPVVPFAESADAYRLIDERPGDCIKLGVTFGS
jgi:threonine dehydrogenase-like Zn-dependent dehydrogenase